MFKSALFWDSQDIFSVFIATQFYTGSLKSVVFNVGEIAPQATVLCIVGVILWFTTFGWRFQFPGERFLQFKHTKISKKQYLLLWNHSSWCTFDSMFRDKGYKTYQSGHVTLKLSSFCVTLRCTNYSRTLRLSLVGSPALRLRFSQKLWMCKYFVEYNVQNKMKSRETVALSSSLRWVDQSLHDQRHKKDIKH